MRFFWYFLLIGLLTHCTAPRYACVDVLNPKVKTTTAKRSSWKKSRPVHRPSPQELNPALIRRQPAMVSMKARNPTEADREELLARLPQLIEILEKETLSDAAVPPIPTGGKLNGELLEQALRTAISEKLFLPQDTTTSLFDTNFEKAKTLGIVSFALSLGSILALAVPILVLPMIAASFATAAISLKKYRRSPNKDFRVFPILAMIIGGLWFLLLVAILIWIIILFSGW